MPSSHRSASDDAVVIQQDDISNYNPDQILPESPEEIKKIRSWLKATDYTLDSGEYHKHLASYLCGTGTWVTSSDPYRTWLESEDDGLLWIKGIPGSGKSVLAAHIVDELSRSKLGAPVLYFFFRQIIDANHEPAALLRDWLDQVLIYSPPLQKRLKELVKAGRSISSISMEDQWANLRLAFSGLAGKVFCVADALDEIDEGNDEFLQSLAALGHWRTNKAKILITSRPVLSVEAPLRQAKLLDIRLVEKNVDVDIASYVEHGLKSTAIPTSDQDLIREAIPGRANGLFLYAKLAMDAFLEPGARIGDVLRALPNDLNDMYTRLLREHADRSGIPDDIQLLILQWVTHATRPLRLLELAEMLDVTYRVGSKSDLKAKKALVHAAAGPLLETLPDETVCVIHHSFTEYLKCMTRSEDNGEYPVLRLGSTHARLATACLSYLQAGCLDMVKIPHKVGPVKIPDPESLSESYGHSLTLEEEPQIRLKYPFFSYAVTSWHVHVIRSALGGFPQAKINSTINSFLNNDQWSKAWLRLQWARNRDQCQGVTSLHVAARFGLVDFAQFVIEEAGADVNAQDVMGRTPLWWAASSGHANVIRMLVNAGAKPDADDKINGLKPLHEAASANHAEAVLALLEAGVDPLTEKTREHPGNWCGNADTSTGHTALMYACHNGHLETLNAFIPFLQDIDTIHRALVWSAEVGRAKLVGRILQIPGVQVNAKVRGDTALVAACRSTSRETIVALIEAGADPTILCDNWGPEFGGIGSGRTEHCGFDEGGKEPEIRGFTALHALCKVPQFCSKFSEDEWQELVTLLIRKGADVNQRSHDGSTALHLAVNHSIVVRILLDAGADANAVDDSGRVLLHIATSSDMISLLAEKGRADINKIHPRDGNSPILIILGRHRTDAILRLLEFHPDLAIKDKQGSGPLHIALKSYSADAAVIKALLAAGADPNERNRLGETPILGMRLHQMSSTTILDILLEAGGDINAQDVTGMTLLSRAMSETSNSSHEDVETLLGKGADLNVRDFKGRTLLHHAVHFHRGSSSTGCAQNEAKTRFDYLLTKGLDVNSVDYCGNTIMHELTMRSNILDSYQGPKDVSLAKQLLDLGVNPNLQNYSGRSPLHILSEKLPSGSDAPFFEPGFTTVFELLIARTNDINQTDNQGLTPLHLASTVSEFTSKRLLDAGANPDVKSFEGLTPLHLATRARQSNIVGQLLEASKIIGKAIVNAEDDDGRTPLYYACMSGRPETVRLLLDAGANASRTDLFDACANFESENALWTTDTQTTGNRFRPKTSTRAASGLTLKDRTRPKSAFSSHSSYNDLDSYRDTTRLEEILDMLVDNGGDPSVINNGPLVTAATSGFDYTVACLVRANERQTKPSRQYTTTISKFAEHYSRVQRDGQFKSVAEFEPVKKNQANSKLTVHLLKQRQYHTMEHGQSQWHAFNDVSKRGLYKKTNLEDTKITHKHTFLLYEAVQDPLPNLEVMRLLVEKFHVDVNEVRYDNAWNLDKQSSYIGTFHEEAAKALISAAADVNAVDEEAYASNNVDLVKILVKNGATVGPDALIAAVSLKKDKVLEALLSTGADPNMRRRSGSKSKGVSGDRSAIWEEYPLYVAATRHEIHHTPMTDEQREKQKAASRIVEILVAHGADPFASFERNNPNYVNIQSDIDEYNINKDTALVTTKAQDTKYESETVTILHDSLANNSLVHPMLELAGLNPDRRDAKGRTVLLAACLSRFGVCSPIDSLLESNNKDYRSSRSTFLDHLLALGADISAVDNEGRNILHLMLAAPNVHPASSHPILPVLPRLTDTKEYLVNQADVYGITPLHLALRYAVSRSDGSAAEALLEAGADPFVTDKNKNTALHILAYLVDKSAAVRSLFSTLLDRGLDINARNVCGETPLFNVNKSLPKSYLPPTSTKEFISSAEALALFEDAGADLFAKDKQGRGLLHIAARSVEKNAATRFELLTRKGLDAVMEDEQKRTALDVAAACDNQKVLRLFDKDNVRNHVTAEEIEYEEYDSDDMGF
ncbi:hypothetical protein N0V90_007892 [Kalmusia sp. IMI 367209]|nr:hypothetical protein N0V90_007892 [Kalmusia sp. IMI 367209]